MEPLYSTNNTPKLFVTGLLDNASYTIKQHFGLIPTNTDNNDEQETDYNTTAGPILRPSQYLPITRNILQPPGPTIPARLIQSLRTSIDLRSEIVAYFADFTQPDIVARNRSHVYFVNVLRQVLGLILPQQTAEASQAISTSVADQSQTGLTEQLAGVVVEDREQEADKATSEHLQLGGDLIDEDPLGIGHEASQNHNYKLHFARHCFLKDLGGLYEFMREKWHDYPVGRSEPVTASTLADVALDMVLRMEETYLRSIGINENDAESEVLYKELHELQQCSTLSQSGSQQLGASEGGIFSLQPAYQLAKCLIRNLTIAYAEELTSGFGEVRHGIPRGVVDPDLLIDSSDTPSDSDFAAKLSELEHAFKDPLTPCAGPHACCGFVEDQILSIVRVAFVRTRVRMSTAFAVSIFFLVREYAAPDLRRIAVPDSQPLLAEVDAAAKQIRSFWNRESNITKAANKAANDNEKRAPKTDSQIRVCNFATGILNGNSRQEPKQYLIQTNLRQYLDMSPLACGLVVAWFKTRQNWESFLSIDQRQTVLFMLHFYNAAKQGEDLKETWGRYGVSDESPRNC